MRKMMMTERYVCLIHQPKHALSFIIRSFLSFHNPNPRPMFWLTCKVHNKSIVGFIFNRKAHADGGKSHRHTHP